jgi:ubiquitin C-terminal hydrolase
MYCLVFISLVLFALMEMRLHRPRGLKNFSNVCYLNALLQLYRNYSFLF